MKTVDLVVAEKEHMILVKYIYTHTYTHVYMTIRSTCTKHGFLWVAVVEIEHKIPANYVHTCIYIHMWVRK